MEIAIAEEKAAQVQLSEKVDALEDESLELCETVEKLLTESEEIATFERGKYLDNIRACCYELLSFNVGVKNIEKVIRSVLSNMTGKSISRLPSKTTLCDMMIESLTVAQAQLAEKLRRIILLYTPMVPQSMENILVLLNATPKDETLSSWASTVADLVRADIVFQLETWVSGSSVFSDIQQDSWQNSLSAEHVYRTQCS